MPELALVFIIIPSVFLISVLIIFVFKIVSSIRKDFPYDSALKKKAAYIFNRLASETNTLLAALAIICTVCFSIAGVIVQTSRSLTGQLITITFNENSPDKNSNGIRFVASIQNDGQNPVSIQQVYVILNGNEEIELSVTNDEQNSTNANGYFFNASSFGLPVGVGEAVRIDLVMRDHEERDLQNATLTACYVVDTLGKKYPLKLLRPYATAEYSKSNEFILATR